MLAIQRAAAMSVLAGTFLAIPGAWGQKAASPTIVDRQRERYSLAINMVHAINAAEAGYKKEHGVYATWATLYNNGDFTSSGTKWSSEAYPTVAHAMYSSGPEIVPGWKLRLLLSKDETAYDVMLEDVNDPKCAYAAFSDERGRIRQGRAVECPL